MNKIGRAPRPSHLAATAIAVTLMAGCAATSKTGDWLRGKDKATADAATVLGAPAADEYLVELHTLASGDAQAQAAIFDDARSAAQSAPEARGNLRYGLFLAAPGHANADPARAIGVLRDVLAHAGQLTPAEISLATIHLEYAERLELVRAQARNEVAATGQRIAAVDAENRRLRQELEDARQKLEAITSIERSIREQE